MEIIYTFGGTEAERKVMTDLQVIFLVFDTEGPQFFRVGGLVTEFCFQGPRSNG